jgi:SAM-dependent methyltransferase
MFARKLASRAGRVIAVDLSEGMIQEAEEQSEGTPNVRFVRGDFLQLPVAESRYDYVASVASLHHMDFRSAIERMRLLLRPGGVLAILGLARDRSPQDFLASAFAVPANRLLRLRHGWYEPDFPVTPPSMSYREVRSATGSLLPGARLRRLLLFRYLLLWRNDQGSSGSGPSVPSHAGPEIH